MVKNSDPKVSLDHEIECTNQLVENNFSNYSSWHYRSKLLPLRYPHSSTSDRIEESKLLEGDDCIELDCSFFLAHLNPEPSGLICLPNK